MTAIVTGKRVRPQQPLGPIPQGSESLEVWAVHR